MTICPACQCPNSPKARLCTTCGQPLPADSNRTATAGNSAIQDAVPPHPGPSRFVARIQAGPAAPETRAEQPVPGPFPVSVDESRPPKAQRLETRAAVPVVSAVPASDMPPFSSDIVRLLKEVEAPIPVVDDASPLRLSLNFNRVFVSGFPSTMDVRLENRGSTILENVVFRVECSAFRKFSEIKCKRILPNQKLDRILEVEPERSGNFVLRCYLNSSTKGKQSHLIGHRRITVNVPPPDPSSISINIGDIKTNQGDNAGLGDEGDVQISNLVDLGKLRTLNDLINLKLDDAYTPLLLEFDGEQTIPNFAFSEEEETTPPPKGLQIPAMFCGHVQPATKLILEPVRDSVATGGSIRAIHLVATREFRIGRTRAAVDYLSWFWPRNSDNDERTRRISQNVHLRMVLEGERILLFDGKTTNGSLLDGQMVPDANGFELQHRGTATLGNEYEIDITPFETGLSSPLVIQNENLWPGPPPIAPSRQGSVRFEPLNTQPALYDSLWVFTDASFGSSHLNPLPLSLPGIGEMQGRIHHYRGQFWIESFANAGGQAFVNDYLLQAGDIVPLAEGQRVKLGETEFSVLPAN